MSKVITMSLWRRPAYTEQVLSALSKCKGIEDYTLIICVEPGVPQVGKLAEQATFAKKTHVIHNPQLLGIFVNIYQCLKMGFENTDYNIHIEDDVVLGEDALQFFEYCKEAYEKDASVFTACAYHKSKPGHVKPEEYYRVRRAQWFTPWGWATWADRWKEINSQWVFGFENRLGWDERMNKVIRGERSEVYPHLSRAQNIGAELGWAVPNAEWHHLNQHTEVWVDEFERPANIETKWEER